MEKNRQLLSARKGLFPLSLLLFSLGPLLLQTHADEKRTGEVLAPNMSVPSLSKTGVLPPIFLSPKRSSSTLKIAPGLKRSPREWDGALQSARERLERMTGAQASVEEGCLWLDSQNRSFCAALLPGKQGIFDGLLLLSAGGGREIAFKGMQAEIELPPDEDSAISDTLIERIEMSHGEGGCSIIHWISLQGGRLLPLRATLTAGGGRLSLSCDLPAPEGKGRQPRISSFRLGPATLPVWRAYAGTGVVVENPPPFSLPQKDIPLPPLPIGGDYTNGLSLVQASDLPPRGFYCVPREGLYTLSLSPESTLTLVPSLEGAFDALKRWGNRKEGEKRTSFRKLAGKIAVLPSQGDEMQQAKEVETAGKYGLGHSLFLAGRDLHRGDRYTLPELETQEYQDAPYRILREAAKRAEIGFCVHENILDLLPSSPLFSPKIIRYNPESGLPDRCGISFCRLPLPFHALFMERTATLGEDLSPEALFVSGSFDPVSEGQDASGTYLSPETARRAWSETLSGGREALGSRTALLGGMQAAALADIMDGIILPPGKINDFWKEMSNAIPIPWIDMAIRSKTRIFGSSASESFPLETPLSYGIGNDGDLCTTAIGGRNPLCRDPDGRTTVMTSWLLGDLCQALSERALKAFTFDRFPFRQHARFGNDAEVWANRSPDQVWRIDGHHTLPREGFYAKTPNCEAGIVLLEGQRVSFSRSKEAVFVDTRPPNPSIPNGHAVSRCTSGTGLGNGQFVITTRWSVFRPIREADPFVHVVPTGESGPVLCEGKIDLPPGRLATPGEFQSLITLTLPESIRTGKYDVLYGFKNSPTQLLLSRDSRNQLHAGTLHLIHGGGQWGLCSFSASESPFSPSAELNLERRMITFDRLATDGAFRLVHGENGFMRRLIGSFQNWLLIPLPGSSPFKLDISLEAYGSKGATVTRIRRQDPLVPSAQDPEWFQTGDLLSISCDGKSQAYEIIF